MSNPVDHPATSDPSDAAVPPPTEATTETPTPTAPPVKQKKSFPIGQILAAILLILVVIFIVENTQDVAVRVIAGPKINAPVFVWLLIAAVVGALIGGLMRFRRKRTANLKADAREARRARKLT